MKKLKIGLVCPYNILLGGGVQSIVLDLSDELIKLGHDVKIITPKPRNYEKNPLNHDNIIFIGNSTDFRSPLHTTVQISASVDTEKIDQILDNEKFDIINLHEPWVPFISKQILQRSKSVNIGTFHAKIPETVMTRSMVKVVTPYLKSVLNDLDALTAVSESAAEYVSSLTDLPITIIPNGIRVDKFIPKEDKTVSSDHPKILFIGRLETRKGVKYLLNAFQVFSLKFPDSTLVIAGDGPNRLKLLQQSKNLGLDNVVFLGQVSESDKLRLLDEADLFCSPALFGESFGIVLLEAMAHHLVTVAGNNSGYRQVMSGIGSLSIVDVKDKQLFADRLELMIFEKSIRRVWINWAKQSIKQYDFERVCLKYLDFYNKINKNE